MRGMHGVVGQKYGLHNQVRKEHQMDDSRFDSLTRKVSQHTDRRSVVKTAMSGTLALLGLAGFAAQSEGKNKKNNNSKRTGYKNDPCATSDDCLKGLRCEGARAGIDPGFPTPIQIPVINGKPGRCRYKKSCGGEQGDVCERNDDCCNGQNLTCDNNRCKRN